MKRNLLLVAALFFGTATFAQFTQSNSPSIGNGSTLYVIDSMAPAYANEIGSNANWDYSSTDGYNNVSRNVTGLDATTTANASSFPNATETIDLEGFLKSYSTTSATEMTSYGFVFDEPSLGEIIAIYDTDPATTYNYPMDENSPAITDNFSGTLEYVLGIPQTSPLTGSLTAEVDGKGTLVLANNSYNNVLRYKITDTVNTTVAVLGAIQMVRTQYEYYDLAASNLPIFIHTSIVFTSGGGVVLSNSNLVLSLEDPSTSVGLTINELSKTSVYPVPATNELNIHLPSTVEAATVTISDVLGRNVYSTSLNSNVKTIDVSAMKKGMYILNITDGETSVSKNIVIK
ncbi:T9SS type A sorting domain-containing protein [Brumimicrobium mesophilum]|uniref:T9SS type A sorting domain-containing protein n=1 Tax=Brumimicrobium mesophilum TaxID=392717 RepID=UPI000D142BCD|nr:T9SS type A sorting domain-containing protein [Brumimicrobium mesophilum]